MRNQPLRGNAPRRGWQTIDADPRLEELGATLLRAAGPVASDQALALLALLAKDNPAPRYESNC
jgi:hypothetical protein